MKEKKNLLLKGTVSVLAVAMLLSNTGHVFAFQRTGITTTVIKSTSTIVVEEGKCGDNVTYKLYDDGTLILTGSGNTYEYPYAIDEIENIYLDNPFSGRDDIKSIIIEGGVTSLSYGLFENCQNLKQVDIQDGVKKIDFFVFENCENLLTVNIPQSVEEIWDLAFGGCNKLILNIYDNEEALDYAYAYDMPYQLIETPNTIKAESLQFEKSTYSFNVDDMKELVISINPSNTTYKNIELTSSNEKVVQCFSHSQSIKAKGAGTATITAKTVDGKTATCTVTVIDPNSKKELNKCDIKLNTTSYTYDGNIKTPKVTVKDGSKTLVKDTDYTVSYKNNVNAGTGTVTITGKGTYTGSVNKTFIINKASYNVTAKDYKGTYDSKSHTITLSGVKSGSTIKYRTSKNGEWTTKKPTRTSAGTTTVYYQITNANYETITGSKNITIAKRSVSTLKYSKLGNKTYTGKQIKYAPTVKYGSKTLKNGTDYKITYGKNVSTGKATVKVTGKGNYEGSKTFTFYIVPKKVTLSSVKAGKKSATVKYKKVTGASGYQIAYSTSKTKGFKYVNVSYKKASSVIKKLKSKKTYYFKVRAYKTVGKTKYYGSYSTIKSCKVK